MRKLVIARRASQAFFLCLFIYILWSTTYPLKGLFPTKTFFHTNPLIMIFTSVSERLLLAGLIFALVMLVLTLVVGRFYCGWICPLGTMIDWTGALRKKKPHPGDRVNRWIRKGKFLTLAVIAGFSLAGIQAAWILDPMVITARFVSLFLIPTITLLLNKVFVILIRDLGFYGRVQDVYHGLRSSLLGIEPHYFSSSPVIFLFFLLVISSALFISRLWCRAVCPLGGLYAVVSRFSFMSRVVGDCVGCHTCVPLCRTGAIMDGRSYAKGECILCMDCVYACPPGVTKFALPAVGRRADKGTLSRAEKENGVSRKNFIFLMLGSFLAMGFNWPERDRATGAVIRPPGSLKEDEFLSRCIRCGNCMKVCPTNGLQPTVLQTGLEGIWTPHLVPEIGYCEYKCTLCGEVCPTGAIPQIDLWKKKRTKLGTAKVDRSLCVAWSKNWHCVVCEEHCPVYDKAIRVKEELVDGVIIKKPYVLPDLCVGCGICQAKCPVRPVRAIKVSPEGADRT